MGDCWYLVSLCHFKRAKSPECLGLVLLLLYSGKCNIMHISKYHETPSNGLGSFCTSVCFCIGVLVDMLIVLPFHDLDENSSNC